MILTAMANGGENRNANQWLRSSLDLAPVENTLYNEECSSGYMIYQPGLLPTPTWKTKMAALDRHFDENAKRGEETSSRLTEYLILHAADYSNCKRSKSIGRSLTTDDTPFLITKTHYFLRKHNEFPGPLSKKSNRSSAVKYAILRPIQSHTMSTI